MQGVQAVPAAKLTRKNKYNEMDNRNLSETLPYGKLAMLGIDKEKAETAMPSRFRSNSSW